MVAAGFVLAACNNQGSHPQAAPLEMFKEQGDEVVIKNGVQILPAPKYSPTSLSLLTVTLIGIFLLPLVLPNLPSLPFEFLLLPVIVLLLLFGVALMPDSVPLK
eukprot:TRINITY_DN15449_c0_g1_i2.p1 TRINITY_DN15449_c0_g1~~TRINITY_DN15449_c0_g1_i2.p1  ORF type:complete len:104 (+),score=0.30 TRINITY_DN15449_c0_g1_i2:27-338(+)